MKFIITVLLVCILGAMAADCFLFSKKNDTAKEEKKTTTLKPGKTICDTSPCKHKGVCIQNPKNVTAYTCNCTTDYHGKNCEHATGCSKKPCRKGVCTNDIKNPSNHTCKCNAGFVGPKCDTADGCAKNPCKNGKCHLDSGNKYKAACTCMPGWGSSKCDKRNCTIVQFKGKHFDKSSNKVYIDQSVTKKFEALDGLAELCKVKIHVFKSFVLQSAALKSYAFDTKETLNQHHHIGQAIKFEIYDLNDKLLCNDICLSKTPIPQAAAKCFIDGLYAIKWKWNPQDPTTINTGYYYTPEYVNYANLRERHQVGCRETKFD